MNPRKEMTDLTICRGFFAAWVFIYHIDLYARFSDHLGPAAGLLRRGYLGVDGFFVLSGLILARVHPELLITPVTAMNFWARRLARIYPVHLAVILILAALVFTGHSFGVPQRDPARFSEAGLIENLLLVHGWGFTPHLGWNYPSWSVSTEWAGYLAFPALALLAGRAGTLVSGQVVIVCIPVLGLLAFRTHGLNLTSGPVLVRFFVEFIAGITGARLIPAYADFLPARVFALIGFGIVVVFTMIGADMMSVLGLTIVLGSLAMRADAEQPPLFGNQVVLRFFGRLSYSFYMSFGTAELLVTQYFRHAGLDPAGEKLLFTAGMTGITCVLALFLYKVVETPWRRLGDRLLRPPEPLA